MVFRHLAKESVVYGGADFITKVLAFFVFPIIAAALSPIAFGTLELIFTVTAIFGLVMNCGLNNAVQRLYWDKDTLVAQQPAIVTSGLAAQIIFGLLAAFIGLLLVPLFLPWIEAEKLPLTWVALVAALFAMLLSQWSQYILDVIRLHFAPWRFFSIALISRVSTMLFGLVAIVSLGLGIDGFLTAQAIVLALVLPVAFLLIRKDINFAKINMIWLKELVQLGYPFIFINLAYWLFGSMDRWMLASMHSVEEVGIYSVAFRFASIVLFVSTAFSQAWSPIAIKILTDHPDSYRTIYGQVLLVLVFVMLIVGGALALFSGELISLIMPQEYLKSSLPLVILCFAIIFQSSLQVTAVGISLEKKNYIFVRLTWLAALINFISNYLLIPDYGASGAAFATLISYIFITVSYFYYTQKLHPIVINWRSLFIIMLLGTLLAIISIIFVNISFNFVIIYFKIFLAAACLVIGWMMLPIKFLRKYNKNFL
jgi:O-antigen/teichoic acid export membrane protein